MNSDLQKLIDLQVVDARIAALKAEVAALPQQVAQIEAKLAGSKAQLDAAHAAMKADEIAAASTSPTSRTSRKRSANTATSR